MITLLFAIIFLAGSFANGLVVWVFIGISLITFCIYRLILVAKLKRINKFIKESLKFRYDSSEGF